MPTEPQINFKAPAQKRFTVMIVSELILGTLIILKLTEDDNIIYI